MQHVDAGGYVPAKLVEKQTPKVLRVLKSAIESFEKDEEVDKTALASLAHIIKNEPQDYTKEEKAAIRKGKEVYEKVQGG